MVQTFSLPIQQEDEVAANYLANTIEKGRIEDLYAPPSPPVEEVINNDDCRASMRSVPQLLNENLVAIDIFPFNPEGNEYERPQRSLIGALGSIVTLCICFAIIVNSFAKFARDEVSRSIQIRAQTDNDTSEIEDMGVIIFVDGEPFYDERFFRIRYRYRAIYNGDQQNDIRPRVYINIPTKTCLLYKDENSPGKNATLGCPDLHAATKLLAAKKDILIQDDKISKKDIAQFPVFPIIQGKYGSDVYW
eukprot:CAMPEP_0194272854 /NCGR_PEP_ID=MMETSP0169-20130528/6313_1 /TAXON_ID=218684 /ORGANISM="Corethron pennatum, Strain L29A3" /LENGTH=247 /DNA_ID=CAMNT_0039015627 /DNA_START=222 /DNA_END=962 /DNA_ORIENTATION=+